MKIILYNIGLLLLGFVVLLLLLLGGCVEKTEELIIIKGEVVAKMENMFIGGGIETYAISIRIKGLEEFIALGQIRNSMGEVLPIEAILDEGNDILEDAAIDAVKNMKDTYKKRSCGD